MRAFRALALLLGLAVPAGAQESDGGFRSLFDGASLEGWSGDRRFWSVEEGAIVGRSTPEVPCERSTYLIWEGGELEDFELRFEFQLRGGNSGAQFRSSRGEGWEEVSGYQADLAPRWTGGLYEQNGREILARRGTKVRLDGNGGRTEEPLVDPRTLQGLLEPEGWNELKVRAVGERIVVAVNGVATALLIDEGPEARARGVLAFQLHAGDPMEVRLRNVRLRAAGPPETSYWLWRERRPDPGDETWFRRSFELRGEPARAVLWVAGDDRFEAYLNGQLVATGDFWRRPVRMDVRSALRPGKNVLAVWVRCDKGPAGLNLSLRATDGEGRRARWVTDGSWKVSAVEEAGWTEAEFDDGGWGPPHVYGPLGIDPWRLRKDLLRSEEVEALEAQAIELPEGFEAELLYSVPRARQGSWVSLALDGKGRALVGDQYGDLYRVSPRAEGEFWSAEPLELELGEAQGLLFHGEDLYVVVNSEKRYASGLYRLRDADGDDRSESVEQLHAFDGYEEHGPHAVVLGPDGQSLYVLGGDETEFPSDWTRGRVAPRPGDDVLSPLWIERPSGRRIGWIARTDLEGRDWEIFAIGLRNAYDAVFGPEGELFTFDSDHEWDVGLPWYRPTRVLHVTSGADFGYRYGPGKWPALYPDSLPPALELGRGSPTGLASGAESDFPPPYDRYLFAGDWSRGQVYALQPIPEGSTFRVEAQVFARGKPLAVSDLAFGPDGALYLLTGGRRVQSGLYRIRWTGPRTDRSPASWSEGKAERQERRRLEGWHRPSPATVIDELWPSLGSTDRFLRFAARTALEHQDPATWKERALAEGDSLTGREALLALIRTEDPALAEVVWEKLAETSLEDKSPSEQIAWLRLHGLALLRLGPPGSGLASEIVAALEQLFQRGDATLERETLLLLVELGAPDVVSLVLPRLGSDLPQEQALALVLPLARRLEQATPEERGLLFRWLLAAQRDFEGGLELGKALARFEQDLLLVLEPTRVTELREAFERTRPGESFDDPPEVFVRAWTQAELLPELRRWSVEGDIARGRDVFRRSSCLTCHALEGRGVALGPDLSAAGSRYTPGDLLETLLDPSAVIAPGYQDTEVWTDSGKLYVGTPVAEDERNLTLRVRSPRSEDVVLPKEEIDLRRLSTLSSMPSGLLDTRTLPEILDLFAYVLADPDQRRANR